MASLASLPRTVGPEIGDVLLHSLRRHDRELHDHVTGVAERSMVLARYLGLDAAAVEEVGRAAELHDIGKIVIPNEILHKPGPLDAAEWEVMRRHTIEGERILTGIPGFEAVAQLVRASHERWDGGGYPDGLAGEEIPLGARIVALCDSYDAMITDRPYRAGMPKSDALDELRRCSGTQFDPAVVDAFLELFARPVARTRFSRGAA